MEVKIGQLLPSENDVRVAGGRRESIMPKGYAKKDDTTHHKANQARALAAHPEAVAEETGYDDVAEETGYADRTLRLARETSERIESGRRLPDLSFSHHAEVAALPPDKQEHFLQKAVQGEAVTNQRTISRPINTTL